VNDDVVLNKVAVIHRCLDRVKDVYRGDPHRLEDATRQDAVVLNLQRAREAAIDLAMHVVADRRLGVPQEARNAFSLLEQHKLLKADLAVRMRAMVGFRNVAVHDDQKRSLPILRRIVEDHLGDFTDFGAAVLAIS
jgi:uncharacterized protein YutE (UPF0331/DUF86 family)